MTVHYFQKYHSIPIRNLKGLLSDSRFPEMVVILGHENEVFEALVLETVNHFV